MRLSPMCTLCAGLRAWTSKLRGALATCSRMKSGSSQTLSPSVRMPSLANSSTASGSRNSTPSSLTIRFQPRSSVSTASGERIS